MNDHLSYIISQPADTGRQRGLGAVARTCLASLIAFSAIAANSAVSLAQSNPQDSAPNAAALERSFVFAIEKAEPSVVAISRKTLVADRGAMVLDFQPDRGLQQLRITSPRTAAQVTGTGVIIDPAGLVLTEYLLVSSAERHIVTLSDGTSLPATIRAADPRSGLAVLQVPGKDLSAITIGDADKLRKGQFVIAIGNPQAILKDGEPSASWGIVSNLAQKAGSHANLNDVTDVEGGYRTTLHHLGTLIQTDAKLTFATGGGALVNLQGEMVGLNTAVATIAGHESPAGYAIPINSLFRRIIDTLKNGREVEYGLLGVGLGTGLEEPSGMEQEGVIVQSVLSGGPAKAAGLRDRDLITHVNGQRVRTASQLQLAVGSSPPTRKTKLTFVRGGATNTAEITLAKYPLRGKIIATSLPPSWRGVDVDYASMQTVVLDHSQAVKAAPDPDGCVLITDVEPESPSWNIGLRPGMFISHVGEQRVKTPDEFRAAVAAAEGTVAIRLTEPMENDELSTQEQRIPEKVN